MTIGRLPFEDPLEKGSSLNGRMEEMIGILFRLGITLKETQTEVERLFISRALKACDGNRSRAAKRLGMHRNTLNVKMERYGLNGDFRS